MSSWAMRYAPWPSGEEGCRVALDMLRMHQLGLMPLPPCGFGSSEHPSTACWLHHFYLQRAQGAKVSGVKLVQLVRQCFVSQDAQTDSHERPEVASTIMCVPCMPAHARRYTPLLRSPITRAH
eukprot:61617-Pleurochrysis_carterae.AAC.6